MKLYRLKIDGFRRIKQSEFLFEEATFLIGQNNCGKSSVLKAIEVLLSAKKQLNSNEYYSVIDTETGETKVESNTIILEAEFRNIPSEASNWRGFKGRIFSYSPSSSSDSGLSITYRKTFELGKDVIIELKSKERNLKAEFTSFSNPQEYINHGIDSVLIKELFGADKLNTPIKAKELIKLEEINDLWDLTDEEIWFQNPGGIPGNVLKMLPRFLLIPAETAASELVGKSGVLNDTLGELFQDVRNASSNYTQAQHFLNELQKELNPNDQNSEFGKLIDELNLVLSSVFPETKFHASADLSDPEKVIKPLFNVEMSSNIRTGVDFQGSGMIRSAAFAMLRFRQKWLSKREDLHDRSLIICFEEPETFLHPAAATQMRDAIYELSNQNSQIVATTHSPYLIDLSRKPRQLLNRLKHVGNEVQNNPFSVTDAFIALQDEDKDYVKMLLKIDDYIARVFFSNDVIIVEGDTEDILIRESLTRLDREVSLKIKANVEVIKARGKAAIIGLVKYLISLGIKPIVVHDRDQGIVGAEVFNEPIQRTVGSNGRIVLMRENVENELGYIANSEKPYKAYLQTKSWGDTWTEIPEPWRNKMKEIFGEYLNGI
jgi:putative ATP-dependent endonuclease of the OLD family